MEKNAKETMITKRDLVEITLTKEKMPKNTKYQCKLSEEGIENWKKVEKIFRLAKKFKDNIQERAFANECIEYLVNFIEEDKARYLVVELSDEQLKDIKKILKDREKLEKKCTPQVGRDGRIYCYHQYYDINVAIEK